jgi:hypothetical protein
VLAFRQEGGRIRVRQAARVGSFMVAHRDVQLLDADTLHMFDGMANRR